MFTRFLTWIRLREFPAPKERSRRPARPASATAHLFEKKQPPAVRPPSGGTADGDFNPYNTGKFDRSASWERISKTQR